MFCEQKKEGLEPLKFLFFFATMFEGFGTVEQIERRFLFYNHFFMI